MTSICAADQFMGFVHIFKMTEIKKYQVGCDQCRDQRRWGYVISDGRVKAGWVMKTCGTNSVSKMWTPVSDLQLGR